MDALNHMLVPIGVAVIVAAMRAVAPLDPRMESTRSLADLHREYGRWASASLVIFAVVTTSLVYLLWKLLVALIGTSGFFEASQEVGLRPSALAWLAPAVPLAMVLANAGMDHVLRALLGSFRYREFVLYGDLRFEMNGKAIEKPGIILLVALSMLAALALARWYVIATPSELRISTPLEVRERRIPIQDVDAIETAPAYIAGNGERQERRTFALRFADGTGFQTRFDFSEASDAEILRFLAVLAERSGTPLTERPLFE